MSDSAANNISLIDQEIGDANSTFVTGTIHQNNEISANLELASLSRYFQELKNEAAIDRQRIETIYKELLVVKTSLSKAEGKLGPLQKMLASLTDRTLSTKKDITDLDQSVKTRIEETIKKNDDFRTEFQNLKIKINDLSRKVTDNSNQPRSSFGNQPPHENWELFERQLAMYDVRIAELDARFQVLESTSHSGMLVWKITDYDRRRAEAVSGKTLSLYSQPFYTSRYGYKMCARIYLNGDGMGKGSHLSLFFVVMKGEYDALLQWPFRQKVTLMLLDQGLERRHLSDTFRPDPTSSSFKRPTSDMNIASGCPLFVAHNVIEGSTYVREDTIFLRIIVDTSDLDNM